MIERLTTPPITLEELSKKRHTVYEMTATELRRFCHFPENVAELARMINNLDCANNFSALRAPFLPELRAIVADLFEKYAQGQLLEIGPGPVAYAAKHLIPFDKIDGYTLVEGSADYARKISHKANAKRWNLHHADFHTMNLEKEFDTVFSLSALDSTPFLYEAMTNIKKHTKGTAIFIQDVFPCPVAILGQEYLHNKGTMVFASEADEPEDIEDAPVLWMMSSGKRVASYEYLHDATEKAAKEAGFDIVEKCIIGAHHTVTPQEACQRGRRIQNARVGSYHADFTRKNDGVRFEYYADLLVVRK